MSITTISELKKFKNWDVELPNFYNTLTQYEDVKQFVTHSDKSHLIHVVFTKGVFENKLVLRLFEWFLKECIAPRTTARSYPLVEYLHQTHGRSTATLADLTSVILPYLYGRQANGCSIDMDFALLSGLWALVRDEDASSQIYALIKKASLQYIKDIRKIILDSLV